MTQVSVIVRTYNREFYLDQALDRVKKQSFKDFEIIIVDDGSTDGTRKIIDKYEIAKVVSLNRQGRVAALNAGLRRADGELIAFLDDDDLWHEHMLNKCVDTLQRECVDIVWTNYGYFKWYITDKLYKHTRHIYKTVMPGILTGNFIPMDAAMIKKDWIIKVGGFDERLSTNEDWDMWLRLAYTGAKFFFIDEVLTFIRVHKMIKSKDKIDMLLGAIQVLEKIKSCNPKEIYNAVNPNKTTQWERNEGKRGYLSKKDVSRGEYYNEIIDRSIARYEMVLGLRLIANGLQTEGRNKLKDAIKLGNVQAFVSYLCLGFLPPFVVKIIIRYCNNIRYCFNGFLIFNEEK